ncbi:MAG: hypothetical protein V3T30_00700, partial [Thermodesulfobacteriota bacterium]
GSTEFVTTFGAELKEAYSLDMGVVHLTEAHLTSDPPTEGELTALDSEIALHLEELDGIIERVDGTRFVGTAGTVTTLAAIAQELTEYDATKINNYVLTLEVTKEIYSRLAALTCSERLLIPALEEGREDLIIAGLAITISAMKKFGFTTLTVSDAGLLEGIIIDNAASN